MFRCLQSSSVCGGKRLPWKSFEDAHSLEELTGWLREVDLKHFGFFADDLLLAKQSPFPQTDQSESGDFCTVPPFCIYLNPMGFRDTFEGGNCRLIAVD